MAIKIPSKNIYNISRNIPSIYIDRVEYTNIKMSYELESKINCGNLKYAAPPTIAETQKGRGRYNKIIKNKINYLYYDVDYADITIALNKYSNHNFTEILKCYSGLDDDNMPYVKYSVEYKTTNGTATYRNHLEVPDDVDSYRYTWEDTYTINNGDIPKDKTFTIDGIDTVVKTTDKSTVGTATITYNNSSKQYEATFRVRISSIALNALWKFTPLTFVNATATKNEPLSLSFSLIGDVGEYNKIEIPLKERRFIIAKNSYFKLESNELLQTSTIYDNKSAGTYKATSIVNNYRNGFETIELLCSIGEYYDTFNNLSISTKDNTKPMTFKIGDIVIPYSYTIQGDEPMSQTAKGFFVSGVDFIFDGATWQKLTLIGSG